LKNGWPPQRKSWPGCFEKEEQKPTLFDVLTAYNSLRRDERSDWSKYGKQSGSVADLKFFSSAVSWMQRAGIVTVEDFDALLAMLRNRRSPKSPKMKSGSGNLKRPSVTLTT
jgi:hypothetical protein